MEIEEAIAEFEKNVKMETAISNVSGTALWVVDESRAYYSPNSYDGLYTNMLQSYESVRAKCARLREQEVLDTSKP